MQSVQSTVGERSRGQGSRSRIGAVVLAAGAASRMGHRPKCLLEWEGVPLLRSLCLALSKAGVDEVVVVAGHYAERISQSVKNLPVHWVLNPRPEEGQVASLHCGLRALPPHLDAVMVTLADQPLIHSSDLLALIQAYEQRPPGTQVVQPDHGGFPGNPVVFSAQVATELLAGPPSFGCRQWQTQHPQKVHKWASTNDHYQTDVDSPEDLDALFAKTGVRLHWPVDLSGQS
jgi:molybdenum cofactor cytidylyltransferase